MLIPLQPSENWDLLNEAYRASAGYKQENLVKCYPNLYLAVDEITGQLAAFLSHKRAFTWMKGFSPLFQASLPQFLRDGFQVQSIDWKTFEAGSVDPQVWVQALPTDTLFVLCFEDHAVTGQKTQMGSLEKSLAEKKIYMIRVSHFTLPDPQSEISPFTIWIGPANLSAHAPALAVCGARFRAPERAIPYGPWEKPTQVQVDLGVEQKDLVERIEKEFSDSAWFHGPTLRRYDRVVLCFQDLTGDRILKKLSEYMGGIDLTEAQTTHVCQWNSIKVFKGWWLPEPTPEQLRGLVVFSLHIAQRDDFIPKLKQTLSELRAESEWA